MNKSNSALFQKKIQSVVYSTEFIKFLCYNNCTAINKHKIQIKEDITMKYVCDVCGYIYDPEVGEPDSGVAAGTKWEDVPEDFVCPVCGVGKDSFSAE